MFSRSTNPSLQLAVVLRFREDLNLLDALTPQQRRYQFSDLQSEKRLP